jgi:hypothetical protein
MAWISVNFFQWYHGDNMRLLLSAVLALAGVMLWTLAEIGHNWWFLGSSVVFLIGSIANSILILNSYKGEKRQ